MHIKHGNDRIVFVIRRFGVVVKVPNLKTSFGGVRHCCAMWRQNMRDILRHPWANRRFSAYVLGAMAAYLQRLVRGVTENWREYVYYLHADASLRTLLAPTYFSFNGLVNVQGYRPSSAEESFVIQYAIQEACDIETVQFVQYYDSHHFSDSTNFSTPDDRTLVFLDYGNRNVQQLLDSCTDRLLKHVRITAGRERKARGFEAIQQFQ